MNRFCFLLVACCMMAASSLFAQNTGKRPHYKLLWKISGNGLTAPSYLFGTMHVEDNRAFEFSDSVLLKISECKAFSLEVHPDSLMRLLLPVLAGQSSKGQNKLRELLSEKDYRQIDSLMQQRTGLSLDRLKTPSLVRMLLDKQEPRKGKGKGTFVDGYLYNIARRQGKTILGIEDAQEQLALLDDFAPENLPAVLMEQLESDSIIEDRSFASMLDLYYDGDIEAMSRYLKENTAMEPGYYDRLITRRNIGMTANIVRQVRKQTTFFAVGAGHLAGEEGLIHLLQQEGYTVQPVKAMFTGLAKKYTYTTKEELWYEYTSPIGAYKVSMPAKPIAFSIDSVGLTLQTYVDIGTSSVFQTTHIPLHGQFKGKTVKYTLDQFVERMKRGGKYKFEKVSRIDVQGLEGREIVMRQGGQFFRAQILLRGDVLYLLQVAPTKAIAYSEDAEKFLRSFRLQEFGKTVWKDFSNATGAFSVQMPDDIKTQILEPKPATGGGRYKIHLYHATDIELGETYLIRYNDFPAGLRSFDDSVYYASLITSVMENMKGRNLQRYDHTIEGKKGIAFTFDVAETNVVNGRILLRGGRTYMLMTVSSKDASVSGVDTFLDSFRLLPTEKVVMQEFDFPLHRVKVKLPASFTTDSIGFAARNNLRYTDKYGEYYALDAQSGTQYRLRVSKLPPYAVAKDADDFLKTLYRRYAGDSVRLKDLKGDRKMQELQLDLINSKLNGIGHERVVVAGQYVYALLVQNAQEAGPAAVEAFFSSFRFPAATGTWDLFTDKTDVLLQAVMSTDTVVVDEAIPALRTYKFTSAALPAIYAAITRASFDTDSYNVRTVLLKTLDRVHDKSTIDFIEKLYPTLVDSMSWKSHALTVLTSMKTQASSQAFLELLEKEQGKPVLWSYTIMQPYSDSLALLNVVLPGVISLSDKLEAPVRIFRMAHQAIDSNALTPAVKKEVLALAVAKAQQRIAALPASLEKEADGIHEHDRYFQALGQLLLLAEPSDAVKGIFQSLHKRPALVETRMVTTEFYLKNNLTLAPSELESIVSDPYYRIDLYTLLKKYGKEKLYPAKYLSQEKFAEGALHQSMSSEDDIPERIKLVGVRSVRYKGQKQNLYVYQYQYDGDDTWHLAFSGPFPEKTKYITETGDYTFSTYREYGKDVDLASVIAEVTKGQVELLK